MQSNADSNSQNKDRMKTLINKLQHEYFIARFKCYLPFIEIY